MLVVHVVQEETVKVCIIGGRVPLKGPLVAAKALSSFCVQVERYIVKAKKRMCERNGLQCEDLKNVFAWLSFGPNYCARRLPSTQASQV